MFTNDWFEHENRKLFTQLRIFLRPNAHSLEIGSYEGRSSIWLSENFDSVTCVDTWEGSIEHDAVQTKNLYEHFLENIQHTRNITPVRGRSIDILSRFVLEKRKFDFIFVDGSHLMKDVLADAVLCHEMLTIGGIIVFDDYTWGKGNPIHQQPGPAIDAFITATHGMYKIIYKQGSIALLKEKDNGIINPRWTLVWESPSIPNWETDWVFSVFGDNIKQFIQRPVLVNNSIIVTQNLPNIYNYIREYEKAGYTYCILHLSDEDLNPVVYPSSCACIFRNYYNPNLKDQRIVYLPLGYKTGFTTSTPTKKEHDWVFAGDIKKSDRKEMVQALQLLNKKGHLYTTQGFNSADCLSTKDYAILLMSSWFAPSPIGNKNNECFRTWEALESGSIPIVLDSSSFITPHIPQYYATLVKACGFDEPIPFPILRSWKDITTIPWKDAPMLQQKCVEWWSRFKTSLRTTCTNKLNEI